LISGLALASTTKCEIVD